MKNAQIYLKSPNKKFPIYSTIGLFYSISAGIYTYLSGLRIDLSFNYGIANFGYVLLVSFIFKGTFLILGLKKRSEIFIYGLVALTTSTIFINLG